MVRERIKRLFAYTAPETPMEALRRRNLDYRTRIRRGRTRGMQPSTQSGVQPERDNEGNGNA